MTIFTLPDLGEGLQEAEIVAWHVSEGDRVIADQPLLSVETDKAVVEVPAPFSGTVEKIIAAEAEVVAIGAPLIEINSGKAKDKGAIVGELKTTATDQRTVCEQKAQKTFSTDKTPAQGSIKAAPAVRKLAQSKGVDLSKLTGSGPDGVITSRDIRAASTAMVQGAPVRGVRKAMAQAMTRSGNSVVPATVTDRANIGCWSENENPTLRLVQAVVSACAKEPSLNAWFDGQNRQLHENVNLAIAVDTPDGLFAPVLHSVEATNELAWGIAELRAAIASRSLSTDDLRGATFTLSNFGMLGGEHAALVVSTPQVGILGAGRIHEACLVEDGQPVVRRVIPLSLSFDHRAVTGGEAARFLSAVRTDLELQKHDPEG